MTSDEEMSSITIDDEYDEVSYQAFENSFSNSDNGNEVQSSPQIPPLRWPPPPYTAADSQVPNMFFLGYIYELEDTRYNVAIWFAYKSDSQLQPSPPANALHHLPYSVDQ